jgi:hypothetical protein
MEQYPLHEPEGWPHQPKTLSGWQFDRDGDYSLEFVLQKLPATLKHPETHKETSLCVYTGEQRNDGFMPWWNASYNRRGSAERFRQIDTTPKNAVLKLCPALIEAGVVTVEERV